MDAKEYLSYSKVQRETEEKIIEKLKSKLKYHDLQSNVRKMFSRETNYE